MLDGGWFNPDVVRQLVEQHEGGAYDHSTPLWSLLMFDAFLRGESGAMPRATVSERVAA
jgi:asparagine synthase (glutamine-hydrolysing)